jgi:hypothetical protein
MATYLQGVTDYIPDYQPFQPDYNFYASFLQTKQNQYDSNYKALSNLYGQYFYADLTRESNIKKKDELLKQIDFNLNRVSGLDLSLEQNVQQATQIFTPFYEDKVLMKDMAYTKDFASKYSRAMSLKTSKDEKIRSQYWDTGIKDMMYHKEEFKNSSDEESLGIANASYTPYVNSIEKYLKLAKDTGLSVDIKESNGRYFIRQKNGDLLLQPLNKLFTSAFANDPALQEVYKVQSYVNRKDYILQNASKFNGDLKATERDYLTKQYATIQEYIKIKNNQNKQDQDGLDKQITDLDNTVKNGNGNEFSPGYRQSLDVSLGIAKDNTTYTDNLATQLNDKASTTTTTSSAIPGVDDLEQLRYQVDAGVSSMLAEQDINEASYIYSRKDMVKDMAADPYGVAAQNYAYKKSLLAIADADKKDQIDYEQGVKTGKYIGRDQEGKPILNPSLFQRVTKTGKNKSGGASDKVGDILSENVAAEGDITRDYADGMVRYISSTISKWVKSDRMTQKQASEYFFSTSGTMNPTTPRTMDEARQQFGIFGRPDGSGRPTFSGAKTRVDDIFTTTTAENFLKNYQKNPAAYLHGRGANNLRSLYSRVTQYANATKGDGKGNASSDFLTKAPHGKFMSYINFMDANEIVRKENKEALVKNLKSTVIAYGKNNVPQIAEIFLDDDLHPISKEAFVSMASTAIKTKKLPGGIGPISNRLMNDLSSEEKRELQRRLEEANAKAPKGAGQAIGDSNYPNLTGRQVSGIVNGYLQGLYGLNSNFSPDKEVSLSRLYDDLARDYKGVIQNGKELKPLTAIKDSKGNAVYNVNENGFSVKTNVPTSPGFQGFLEFVNNDMNNINFYDTTNNPISFYGGTKDGINKTKALFEGTDDIYRQVKIAELILDRYYNNIGSKDPKTFKLYSTQVSAEDRNKGSMILYPSMDVLKELMSGEDKGLITNDVANAIVTNGISFISNKNNFSNSIFQANKWTPMQTIVNALGSYEYEDPMGGGKLLIEKDPSGLSDYMVNVSFRELMPDGSIQYTTTEVPSVNYQNNIDYAAQIALPYLQKQVEANTTVWNTYMSKGFAPGVSLESPESKRNQ